MALSPLTTTFTLQGAGAVYGINAYGPDYIEVNGVRHDRPLLLHPESGPTPLASRSSATLCADDLVPVVEMRPEVVLIGTGPRQVCLKPHVLAPLTQARVGVECMGLAAACRTFNLLAAEGRKTIAVLLFE